MVRRQLAVFFLMYISLAASMKLSAQILNIINVDGGPISGSRTADGKISVYKGIPFAASPVGELRWKAPQPVKPWASILKCEAFAASPMQAKPVPFSMWSQEFLIPEKPISEDCLYLNVWTGAALNTEKRPVLVWIYGGGFASGGSGVPIYDGEAMAKKGIVFVSINYRVGIFGFFAHPELSKESGHNASGNYGLMDQVAALQWVKKNIAAFGGDAGNVTIAGQSAGSMSVNCLVASPLAKGLFKKAIAQSGASLLAGPFGNNTLLLAEQDGEKTATALHASSLSDLRKISAGELMKAQQNLRGPIIDAYVLPESIANIFVAGRQNDVALLTGWNEDEGLIFGPIKTAADFRKDVGRQYGADSTTFLKYYPGSNDAEAASSQLKVSRDMIFGVQNYTWANVQSKLNKQVYVYRFKRKVPATGEYVKYGAFHTGEVPYAYDNLKFVKRPWEPADPELARVMSSYWANFITSGDPNGKDLPQWPTYKTDKQVMLLDVQQKAEPLPDEATLDFMYLKMTTGK